MKYDNMLKIAMEQSAKDMNCNLKDFLQDGHIIVGPSINDERKNYFKEEFFFSLTFYGKSVVATVDLQIREFAEKYLTKFKGYRAFSSPEIMVLNEELNKYDRCICNIAEYFLPDPDVQVDINNDIEVIFYEGDDLQKIYEDKRYHNALVYNNSAKRRDVLAVAGYINGEVVGVAGVSNDAAEMWQLGIDVLPEFRNKNIAATLTKALTDEVIRRGKVPFYCTAWSNVASKRNAIKCGYKHAWVELSAEKIETAYKLIGY